MAWAEYEAVGDSTLYGGPKEGPIKAVLSRIAYLIRDKKPTPNCPLNWCNAGEKYLSGWTGFSLRTVERAVARLVADAVIYVEAYRLDNGYKKNRYSLNMEKIAAAKRADPCVESEEEPPALEAVGVENSPRVGLGSPYPPALEAVGHPPSRVKPPALKGEATRLGGGIAVELSSVLAVGAKQLDKKHAGHTETQKSKPNTKSNTKSNILSGREFASWFGAEEVPPVHPSAKPNTTHSSAALPPGSAEPLEALATRVRSVLLDESDTEAILARLLACRETMNGDASLLVPTLTWFLDTNDEGRLVEYFSAAIKTPGPKQFPDLEFLNKQLPVIVKKYRALQEAEARSLIFQGED